MKTLLATLALAVALPVTATAAPLPISIGDLVSDDVFLFPGGSATFEFEATEAMRIASVAYTLNGFSESDLLNMTFGVNGLGDSLTPDQVNSGGGVAEGGKVSEINLVLRPLDTFTIMVSDGITQQVNFDFTFVPQPVPLPAAGLLLGFVLLGSGLVARRFRTA